MGTSIQGTFEDATAAQEAAEEGWGGPQVCDIVAITYRQLDYWDRTDLLKPSLTPATGSGTQRRYSYLDLVQLKVIKGLLDAGVRLQTARKVIESLRERRDDWQAADLVIDGANTVLARDGEHLVDLVRKGQGVLNIVTVGAMTQELDAAISKLAPAESTAASSPAERRAATGS
jgi:DNA-binding transcriptional MerR regulator